MFHKNDKVRNRISGQLGVVVDANYYDPIDGQLLIVLGDSLHKALYAASDVEETT